MGRRTPIRFCIGLLVIISSGGCINYEQETYLNDDLSGRMEVCMFPNPKVILAAAIKKTNTSSPIEEAMIEAVKKGSYKINVKEESFYSMLNKDQVKNGKFTKSVRDDVTCSVFVTEFDDIRKLYEGKRKVSVTENSDGSVTYTEYFNKLETDQKTEEDKQDDAEMFKECQFKYVLHMPREIIKANTDKIDKNTAVWELPIETVIKNKDFHITATMKGEDKFRRLLKRFKK